MPRSTAKPSPIFQGLKINRVLNNRRPPTQPQPFQGRPHPIYPQFRAAKRQNFQSYVTALQKRFLENMDSCDNNDDALFGSPRDDCDAADGLEVITTDAFDLTRQSSPSPTSNYTDDITGHNSYFSQVAPMNLAEDAEDDMDLFDY